MSLAGKVALVTGASRGIGAEIANHLGDLGAVVVGTATSESGAEAIGQRISELGHTGRGAKLNVTEQGSISELIKQVTTDWGAPAILVNNAGITKDNLMLRMKDEEWSELIETNLSSVFRLTKACLRGMTKARWGRIINISSVVGSMGNMGQCNYAAAKAGVEGFSRSLAKEVGTRNITVNTVAPGFIDTDMTRVLDDAQREAMLSIVPMQRLGTPKEIAGVVAFLTSDSAAYMTGETLHVNGGMYMS